MERYDSYKDSGVDWIGQIPEHWEVQRLASYFDERRVKVSDKEYPALSVTKNGICGQLENVAKTDNGDNRKLVLDGDFVINSRSDRKGSSGLSSLCGSVSLINIVLAPRKHLLIGQFAHFLLKSHYFIEEYYRNGRGIVADLWTTRYSEMKLIKLAIPPISEQQAIAAYLDEETGKLDAAVEKLDRMVEVLKERKQLIISKAVTRGLDDSAPLKDSGVEWIGQIPEHWEIIKLKYISSIKGRIGWNGLRSEEFEDSSYAYLVTGQDFKGSNIVWSDCYQINQKRYDEDPEIQLKNGDLLITKDGSIGKVAKVSELDKPACLNSGIFVIKPKGTQYIQGFMYWLLNSIVFKSYTDFSKTGATISHLYQNVFEKMPCILPSIKEQQAIAAYLDEKVGKLDEAIEKQLRMIELLKERKQILISDVVTGKIKVA